MLSNNILSIIFTTLKDVIFMNRKRLGRSTDSNRPTHQVFFMLHANFYNKHPYFVQSEDKVTDTTQHWGDVKYHPKHPQRGRDGPHAGPRQELLDSAGRQITKQGEILPRR